MFENQEQMIKFILNTKIIKYQIQKKLKSFNEDLLQDILIIFLNKDLFFLNTFTENEFKAYITTIAKNQIYYLIQQNNSLLKKTNNYYTNIKNNNYSEQEYTNIEVNYCEDDFYNMLREYKFNNDIFKDQNYNNICYIIKEYLSLDEKKLLFNYINTKSLRELSRLYNCSHTFIIKKVNNLKNKIISHNVNINFINSIRSSICLRNIR